MAIFETKDVKKLQRERGLYSGKAQTVTGELQLAAGASIATTDLIHGISLGENIRPNRVIVQFVPKSGTPVLTNPTFAVGVKSISASNYTDAKGNSYAPAATSATALVASMVLDTDEMKQDIEVSRPVADSVSGYAPFYVTLTPAGAGAFSVAGGDGTLKVTVEFLALEDTSALVYDSYSNTKYKN